jgi:hypothetical protein
VNGCLVVKALGLKILDLDRVCILWLGGPGGGRGLRIWGGGGGEGGGGEDAMGGVVGWS